MSEWHSDVRANSQWALCAAVADIVRGYIPGNGEMIKVTVDPHVWPVAGQVFIGVYPGRVISESMMMILERHFVRMAVTHRFNSPIDRTGKDPDMMIRTEMDKLIKLSNICKRLVHMNEDIRIRANKLSGIDHPEREDGAYGFIRPLSWLSTSDVSVITPDMFFADSDPLLSYYSRTIREDPLKLQYLHHKSTQIAGLQIILDFGEALRAMALEDDHFNVRLSDITL